MIDRDGQTSDVLAGIRVLDFGRYIAGPYCAALLGDLGADVIRVERRGGGEDRWVAPVAPDGVERSSRSSWRHPTSSWRTCRPRCSARSRSISTACAV